MLVRAPSLDFTEAEITLASLLAKVHEPSEAAQRACEHLGRILGFVFRSLERKHEWKRWELDDLECRSVARSRDVVSLHGDAHWLSGGARCSEFRVDVALDSHPLLYSYKFFHKKKGNQVLYVAKTPSGWVVNGA